MFPYFSPRTCKCWNVSTLKTVQKNFFVIYFELRKRSPQIRWQSSFLIRIQVLGYYPATHYKITGWIQAELQTSVHDTYWRLHLNSTPENMKAHWSPFINRQFWQYQQTLQLYLSRLYIIIKLDVLINCICGQAID